VQSSETGDKPSPSIAGFSDNPFVVRRRIPRMCYGILPSRRDSGGVSSPVDLSGVLSRREASNGV